MALWHCSRCRGRLRLLQIVRWPRLCDACAEQRRRADIARKRAEAAAFDTLQTAHEVSLQTGTVPHDPVQPKVTFTCSCGKHLRVVSQLRGRRVICPQCGRAITVPLEI